MTGDQIKQKRKDEGLTTKALASKLHVKAENLYKWEKGTSISDPEDYIKIKTWLESEMENVPFNAADASHKELPFDERMSLERTLENLSEDKVRSTAIMERLVALLEQQFNSALQSKDSSVIQATDKQVDNPPKPIDLSLDKKYRDKGKGSSGQKMGT